MYICIYVYIRCFNFRDIVGMCIRYLWAQTLLENMIMISDSNMQTQMLIDPEATVAILSALFSNTASRSEIVAAGGGRDTAGQWIQGLSVRST